MKDIPQNVNHIKHQQLLASDYDIEVAFLEGMATRFIGFHKTTAKKVAWVHTDLLNLHWTKRYFENDREEERCYSLFDKIVFVSGNALVNFEKLFTVDTPKLVVHNPIDKKTIVQKSKETVNKDTFTICSVNRLIDHKRVDLLINAVSLLKADGIDFELWIVGEGDERENLNLLVKTNGLEKHVVFHGFKENPYPYMRTADIFAITSKAEGMSLVVCEALCLGKPIISSNVMGLAELLDNGRYGMLVEQSEKEVYEGMKRLISDKALCADYEQRALERAEMFNKEKIMNEVYEVINF